MGLIAELRRRNVFRMAALYVMAAWLVMQVAEVIIGLADLPDWLGPAILVLLAIGLPISLVFSWFFEVTPEGLSLEKDVPESESIAHVTGRRMDFVIIAILSAGLLLFAYDKWWPREPLELSIAVLPFDNMSADPEGEELSDGISVEISNLLTQIQELKVIASTTSLRFKGKDVDIATVAEQIDVRHILKGSVRRSGDRVRITAHLIDATDSSQLWSQAFDRDFNAEDLFGIQTDVAIAIVKALVGELPPQHELAYKKAPTTNLEAYRLYLLAGHHLGRGTSEAVSKAMEYLQRATSIDPHFAAAHVALARSYWTLREMTGTWPKNVSKDDLKALVQRGLELDDANGEAHAMLGLLVWQEDPQRARAEFDRAMLGNPGSAFVYEAEGYFMGRTGQMREALKVLNKGIELDPLSARLLTEAAWLAQPWDAEAAAAYYRQAIEIQPTYVRAYNRLGTLHWNTFGRLDEAMRWLRKGYAIDPDYVNTIAMIGSVYRDLNADDEAERWFRHGMSKGSQYALPRLGLADVFHFRDQHNEEFRLLDDQLDEFTFEGNSKERVCDHMLEDKRYEEHLAKCTTLSDYGFADEHDLPIYYLIRLQNAQALSQLGRIEEAEAIWAELEERYVGRTISYGLYAVADVLFFSDQGKMDQAVDELREAVDSGYRFFWRDFFRMRNGGSGPSAEFWSDPRVIAISKEIAQDVARQLQSVREMEKAGAIVPLGFKERRLEE